MPATLSKPLAITSWVLQVLVAVILGQTLFFKLTGTPESVHIFETMGMEPWGRYATAGAELVAVVLLLVPRAVVYGAALALMVIAGALGGHLTRLGIAIMLPDGTSDGGLLFGLAVTVFAAALGVVFLRRESLPVVGPKLVRPRADARAATRTGTPAAPR